MAINNLDVFALLREDCSEVGNPAGIASEDEFCSLMVLMAGDFLDESDVLGDGCTDAFLELAGRYFAAVGHDVRQSIQPHKCHLIARKRVFGLLAEQLQPMHYLWRLGDVHSLLSHQLLSYVIRKQIGQVLASQLIGLTSQHLHYAHIRIAHPINGNREASVPKICNCDDLTLLPPLPILLVGDGNAVTGADHTKMPDLSCLNAPAQCQPIAIDLALKDSHNQLDFLLGEQVLEMCVGVEDSLDDQYHCKLCMEILDGRFVIQLDLDVAIVALLEAVIVVLSHCLKCFVLVLH